MVGGEEAILVDKRETISRLIVQAARQSGVSVVYTELLDFAGDEIYFRNDPALHGESFATALIAYEDCSVIGVFSGGKVFLNPPSERTIAADDSLIAIAEDDARLLAAAPAAAEVEEEAITASPEADLSPQRTLVLGWNHRATSVLRELDEYMRPGSTVTVVAPEDGAEAAIARDCAALRNISVEFRSGSTTDRLTLDGLGVENHDHVIVLCYLDRLDAQRADAQTLVTLLHLRDIAEKRGGRFSIVSEMLDDRNRELAEVTQVDDVIVSDKLISLMLAQISENEHLKNVFSDLFAAEGSEVYLKPISEYLRIGAEVSFVTAVESARRRGEVAIGYRLKGGADDPAQGYGVRINPPKSQRIAPAEDDLLIVLAEQ
jgi:hypothetical protein